MSDVLARLQAALSERYFIERSIGEGAMATVYLARDLKHDRPVALKVLRPDLSALLGTDRFLKEITLTAHLRHPHILPLHDSGAAGELLFYVMPFVSGETLRQRLLRERQLPVDEAVRIAVQVASAIEYAHSQGLIHRDIKPENILLEAGQAVISDFGIALAVRTAGGSRLTETGLSVGTPQYMSPEQAAADRELDPRSDVYSLACVTYEMLAGDPPHTASTVPSILAKVLTEVPRPLFERRPTVPLHVSAAVAQGLEILPADRFKSAGDFAIALEGRLSAALRVPHTTGPRRRSRATIAGLALGTIAMLAAGALADRAWTARHTDKAPARWSVVLPDSAPLAFVGEAPLGIGLPSLAVSLKAKHVVYVGGRNARTSLYVHEMGTHEIRRLAGTEGAFHPFFSPDGTWIAFFAGGRLKKANISGGTPTVLADVIEPQGGTWSDRNLIYVADQEGRRLSVIPAGGGTLTPVREGLTTRILSPSAIPHSNWLLHSITPGSGGLAVTSTESGETRILTRSGPASFSSATPDILYGTRPFYIDGYLVYVAPTEGRLLARRFDVNALEVRGDAFTVLEGVRVEVHSAQTANSGTGLVYAPGGDARTGHFVWVGTEGRFDTLGIPRGAFGHFDLSPSGNRLVLSVGTTEGRVELQVLDLRDLSRGPLERWRPPPGVVLFRWAPDERWVALSAGDDSASAFRVPFPLGSATDTLSGNFRVTSFSPEGRSLIGWVKTSTEFRLAHLQVDNGMVTLRQDRPGDQFFGSLSPSGDWLALTSTETGAWEVFVEKFPGPGPRIKVSVTGGEEPLWAPRGDKLYYRNRDSWYVVPFNRLTGQVGTPAQFVTGSFVNVPGYEYDVSADGDRLLLIHGPAEESVGHIRVIRDLVSLIRAAERRRQ